MESPVRVADYVFSFVAEQGVSTVFLVPGGGAMFLADAAGLAKGVDFVPNHHEQASSIAAEAYSRINGTLGVAVVTTGPGGTNAITGVAGAWIESVPMLVISGQVKRADLKGDTGVRQIGPQEVDIVSLVRPITKYAATVMDAGDIRYHLEKAVHLATSGRRGPVWVDIPLDIQAATVDGATLRPFVPEVVAKPDLSKAADEIIDLLNQAERPLILAGHGIRLAGAAETFRQLYEALQIPVVATWNAMDLIPASHPLSVGKPGTVALRAPNFAVQNCDLLIGIGARFDNVVTAFNPARFGRDARKVVVDVDPAELAKFTHHIDLKVEADAAALIGALLERRSRIKARDRSPWLARCAEWKRRYTVNDGKPFPTSGAISHYHLMQILSEEIPEDTLVVTGSSGLAVEVFYTVFQNKPGQRVFLTSGLGAMGYGLPAMIGAGVANGRKPFVGVESDGSLQMNLQELATLKAQNLPVRMFVVNNNGYASIRNTQRNYFDGRYVGTGPEGGLFIPDIVAVANAVGIPASSVSDVADLRSAVRRTLEQTGPVLLDVRVMNDESLWPKSAALPQPDGSMLSMPLEDMSPLLPRAELRAQMLVPLAPESEKVRD
ncbi:thiamine pyrophosphate-binding protein [Telmatospirillum siberiense]|uniref:Acetolactate synthase n=1 Tax=Telmatospirillum siberiense TaxID=382514 RepID=A0A2N3Q000_9PROT|nr:thiamine pyrophosphate-binding protein [Telmatospirillum siberiense]PKU25987.1 acetolactate synthase [Telmatospirillum siberiense]